MDAAPGTPLTGSLAIDSQGLARLKRAAGAQAGSDDQKKAILESARQVEALFVTQLLRSMRETRMESGLFKNPGSDMFEGMLEQQRAQAISARGLGLANVIARQLENVSQPRTPDTAATPPEKR